MVVKDVKDIPRSVWKRNQPRQALQKHTICLTDSDCSYILEEFGQIKQLSIKGISVLSMAKNKLLGIIKLMDRLFFCKIWYLFLIINIYIYLTWGIFHYVNHFSAEV